MAASSGIEVPMRRVPVICLFLLAGIAAPPATAQHDHASTPAAPASAPAQRFATDAVLRGHMRHIRAAVGALGHYEHGHLGPEQAKTLAGNIEGHVRHIIAACKLPPDADVALHGIIAPLLQGAAALEAAPEKKDAIPPMREALQRYVLQFDDPGVAVAE